MTTKLGVLAFTVAFVSPFAASAQEFSGAVTLGFSRSNYDLAPDMNVDALTLDGRFNVALAEGWSVGARYNSFDQDYPNNEGIFGSLIGLEVDYQVTDTFAVGVYLEQFSLGLDDNGIKYADFFTSRSVGIEGHYTTDKFDIGFHYGTGTPGGQIGYIFSTMDVTHVGLSGHYDVSDKLMVGGSVVRTTVEAGGGIPDLRMTVSGIAAVYSATDTINLFGGVARFSNSFLQLDDTTMSLGGTYDLSAQMGMPLVASLELARTKSDSFGGGENIDSVRLGLTLPIGKGKVQAPLNSSVDAILNPSRSAFSQWFLSY